MVKIMAKHKFRSKTVELNISEITLLRAENGYDFAIRRIFEIYLMKCGYSRGKLQPRSLKFWRVEEQDFRKPKNSSFSHRTDTLSACEKENCSFCNAGKFEECPNNLHK